MDDSHDSHFCGNMFHARFVGVEAQFLNLLVFDLLAPRIAKLRAWLCGFSEVFLGG